MYKVPPIVAKLDSDHSNTRVFRQINRNSLSHPGWKGKSGSVIDSGHCYLFVMIWTSIWRLEETKYSHLLTI